MLSKIRHLILYLFLLSSISEVTATRAVTAAEAAAATEGACRSAVAATEGAG